MSELDIIINFDTLTSNNFFDFLPKTYNGRNVSVANKLDKFKFGYTHFTLELYLDCKHQYMTNSKFYDIMYNDILSKINNDVVISRDIKMFKHNCEDSFLPIYLVQYQYNTLGNDNEP